MAGGGKNGGSVLFRPAGSMRSRGRSLDRRQGDRFRVGNDSMLAKRTVKKRCNNFVIMSMIVAINEEAMDIGAAAFTTSLNFLSNTLFSVNLADYESHASQELKEIVSGVVDTIAKPNLSDFFPVLRAIDPQGIRRRTNFYFGKLLQKFDEIIGQRLQERGKSPAYLWRNDLLEVLLDITQQQIR
nr:inactive cytochrome P450 76AD1-like [Coffea arabica]